MPRRNPLSLRSKQSDGVSFQTLAERVAKGATPEEMERWNQFKEIVKELRKTPSLQATTLVRMARHFSEDAIAVIANIMLDPDVPPGDRLRAAELMLNRGYGKAQQIVQVNTTHNEMSDQELINAVEQIHLEMRSRQDAATYEAQLTEPSKLLAPVEEEGENEED